MSKHTTPSTTTETIEAPFTPTDVSVTRPGAALRRQARELLAEAERLDTAAGHPAPSDLLLAIDGREGLFEGVEDTGGLTDTTVYVEEGLPGVIVLRICGSSGGGEEALDEEFLFSSTEARKMINVLDVAAEDADAIED